MDVRVRRSASPGDERRGSRVEVVDADVRSLDARPPRVDLAPGSAADEDGDEAGVGGGDDVVVDAVADVGDDVRGLVRELDQPGEEGRGGLLDAPRARGGDEDVGREVS